MKKGAVPVRERPESKNATIIQIAGNLGFLRFDDT